MLCWDSAALTVTVNGDSFERHAADMTTILAYLITTRNYDRMARSKIS